MDTHVPEEGAAPAARFPVGMWRVLVADDDRCTQIYLTRTFERFGCLVDVAGDGRAAVEFAVENRYNLIVMDCYMPVMDGWEAAERIRQAEGPNRHTPIIAISASPLPEDRQQAVDSGMDEFLAKPINTDLIHVLIVKFLAGPPSLPMC